MSWLKFLYYFCVRMIKIEDKKNCCGCGACARICPRKCPRKCIEMRCDEEGFAYACVDEQTCVGCSLCEQLREQPRRRHYSKRHTQGRHATKSLCSIE